MADTLLRALVHGEVALEAVKDPAPGTDRPVCICLSALPFRERRLPLSILLASREGKGDRKLSSKWGAFSTDDMSLFLS